MNSFFGYKSTNLIDNAAFDLCILEEIDNEEIEREEEEWRLGKDYPITTKKNDNIQKEKYSRK